MQDVTTSLNYEIFGPKGCVYPGHPLSIAYLILLAYPSYEAATSLNGNYPEALTSAVIPGAGGNVHAALDFLKSVPIIGVERAIEHADHYWAQCASGENFGSRHGAGQLQADAVKERLRAQLKAGYQVRVSQAA